MNLFESSLQDLKTKANSIYIEAVAKIFNVLFEDTMGDAKRAAYSAKAPDDENQTVAELQKDAIGTIARFINELYVSAKAARFADPIAASIPQDTFDDLGFQFEHCLNGTVDWNSVKTDVKQLCMLFPKNAKAFENNLKLNKMIDVSKAMDAFYSYRDALVKFCSVLPKSMVAAKASGNKAVADILSAAKAQKPQTAKTVTGTATDAKAGKKPATATGAAVKATKKPAKAPEPEVTVEKDPYRHIIGTVTPELPGYSITIACGPEQADKVMSDVNEAIKVLTTARHYFIKEGDIKASNNEGKVSIVYAVPSNIADQRIITLHNVALYCLMLYIKGLYPVSNENIGISTDVANSVVADSTGSQSALKRLMGSDSNSWIGLKNLDTNELATQLAESGDNHDFDASIVNAASACIKDLSTNDPEGFLKFYDPQTEKELAEYSDMFTKAVANNVAHNDDEFLTAESGNNSEQQAITDRLNELNIAELVRGCITTDAGESDDQRKLPYNEDAANVIGICQQTLVNKENNNYSFDTGHTADPNAREDDSDAMDNVMSAFDTNTAELSELPQFND